MKLTRSSFRRAQCGNVLIMTLVFFGVVALTTAAYLSLAKSRALIRARSTAWNTAIPVAEAGIEEGFTHLHDDSNALAANLWTPGTNGGQPVVTKSRTFPDGSYFSVTLYTALKNSPLIYSTGFVPAPLGAGYISRTVRVAATNNATFGHAVAAKLTITMGGSGYIDSYDSSSTNGSTGGLYDPVKRRANANVVTDSQAQAAISTGSERIYGTVNTGPAGTVTTGNGGIGDLAWNASHSGIQPGAANNTMNVAWPDATLPSPFLPSTPLGGVVQGANYTYVLNSGSYSLATLKLSGGQAVLVTGNAVLLVTGNISLGGNSSITIATNASLQLYGGGASTDIGSGIINQTGVAANFSYYGLPNNTSVTVHGSLDFVGTVYAPEAAFTFSGGGGFFGACVVNSFTKKGGGGFHYDQALWSGTSSMALLSYTEL